MLCLLKLAKWIKQDRSRHDRFVICNFSHVSSSAAFRFAPALLIKDDDLRLPRRNNQTNLAHTSVDAGHATFEPVAALVTEAELNHRHGSWSPDLVSGVGGEMTQPITVS